MKMIRTIVNRPAKKKNSLAWNKMTEKIRHNFPSKTIFPRPTTTLPGADIHIYSMDNSVLPETETLVFSIFSLVKIWKSYMYQMSRM